MTDFANCARYVVYSTCSIYSEENENVIRDIMKQKKEHHQNWRTVDLSQYVDTLGIRNSYLKGFHFDSELGCLRICSVCGPKNYLNGFFLAIFERIQAEEEQ